MMSAPKHPLIDAETARQDHQERSRILNPAQSDRGLDTNDVALKRKF